MTEKAHENPLVPNARLREMYSAMAEMRVLDEHIAKLQRGKKTRQPLESTKGQEACRVSTAIGLEDGDLISDAQTGVVMELLFGAKAGSVLRQVAQLTSTAKKPRATTATALSGRQLPAIENAEDRLRMAMGAALSFKTLKRANLVVAYVRHGEVSGGEWSKILTLAGKLELPILFVVLPKEPGKEKRQTSELCGKARSCGVPGIPVDAADAVALYRVTQESIGRMRSGGGAVLIECMTYRLKSKPNDAAEDPLVQMRGFLLGRKLCKEAWLDRAGDGLRRRTAAKRKG